MLAVIWPLLSAEQVMQLVDGLLVEGHSRGRVDFRNEVIKLFSR